MLQYMHYTVVVFFRCYNSTPLRTLQATFMVNQDSLIIKLMIILFLKLDVTLIPARIDTICIHSLILCF